MDKYRKENNCRNTFAGANSYKPENDDNKTKRPVFPKRAVITAGMPYGNKELHFGHIGGVFIHADVFARFLRDRIGRENVIFVSGTDCYGSPILESYRKLCEEGKFCGSILEYVKENHEKQKAALDDYEISLDLYGASALGRVGDIHNETSRDIFMKLYEKGYLEKLSTAQFYDPELHVLLNGRQVTGQCPIEGCTSETGYADECSLGHQYMPSDLINPISTLSGKTPQVIEVTNWYFELEEFQEPLKKRIEYLRNNSNSRKYLLNTMEEFLRKPMIYIKKNQVIKLEEIKGRLPDCEYIEEDSKNSIILRFPNLKDRELAANILGENSIYFRTGKTLVPFRLTGNIEWGVKAPVLDSLEHLTFWVWPESLWAPISFTKAYLEIRDKQIGKLHDNAEEYHKLFWKDWWCSSDATVYQFIGEDNIYFYGIAEMAMFMALQEHEPFAIPEDGDLTLPHLIANNHVLFMDKKASTSGSIKPPMAKELLMHYTTEQLRIHFLSYGLDNKSVNFMPKVYMEDKGKTEEGIDPVLKEGNLLTNVFNRIVRSCFYTTQKYYDSVIPKGAISDAVIVESEKAILEYERHMYNHTFHRVTYVLDTYIRNMNKYWVNSIRIAENENKNELRKQVLIDTFQAIRVAVTLLHPIAPSGCEMVREYLGAGEDLWDWDMIFMPLYNLEGMHSNNRLKFLEPKVDFFKKHESQFSNEEK